MGKRAGGLLCLLCLCLTSCGEKAMPVHRIDWQTAPAYAAEDAALPVELCALSGSCTDGGIAVNGKCFTALGDDRQLDAYFAGDKSLDEAAALIQSRASIYVGEQQ